MKRIAISQRRDAVVGRDETRDALDVRLSGLLWELGFLPLPLVSGVSDPAAYVTAVKPDAFLLSGGNDIGSAPARDALERAILDYAVTYRLPVLGICRGLQMINHYQGGTVRPIHGHAAVTHWVAGPLYESTGRYVNSYHDQGLMPEELGRDLDVLARAQDGTVEAVRHHHLPWLGIMWHPERDQPIDPRDHKLIKRHLGEFS